LRALLLGSGGRESALASALSNSDVLDDLVVAPGNPGIAQIAEIMPADIADPTAVVELARHVDAGLVVVGPEAPLVAGVADALGADRRTVFGPSAAAARIEESKSYAKDLMERTGIRTARGQTFQDPTAATAFMDELGPPYVIKADGLAAGKGVVVTNDRAAAIAAIEERLVAGTFGDAGRSIVVEEFLDGPEASLIAFTDGRTVVPCEPAQDYKRVDDGDRGPNTGGMGSYSPVPVCPPPVAEQIVAEVLEPMVEAMRRAGAPFVGALYAGLALTERGPRVIEFNARFGDPETQALMPRLESDFGEVCLACATGELEGTKLAWSRKACVTVVLSSHGYPGSFEQGKEITGIEDAQQLDGVEVFHAGTRRDGDRLVTAGGRVLAVSALGEGFGDARGRAYDAAGLIDFEGKHLRTDIAERAEQSERSNA
jgi:phosphoribosylamine--glycine ligase